MRNFERTVVELKFVSSFWRKPVIGDHAAVRSLDVQSAVKFAGLSGLWLSSLS